MSTELSAETYWNQTRRPLPCLVFLLPLVVLYEVGVILAARAGAEPELLRNGADSWLRWTIERAGLSPIYILPVVLLAVFVSWQCYTREPWRIEGEVMLGMLGESLVLAVALMVVGRIQDMAFHRIEAGKLVASLGSSPTTFQELVCYIGAGIYEETLFRLLLLPAVFYCLTSIGIPTSASMTAAMTASALAFSGAHHVGPMAEPFVWFSFIFRWIAGLFFASVFVLRGFGIAVGAHAAYDILVGVLQFEL
jgi:hypothetical protein